MELIYIVNALIIFVVVGLVAAYLWGFKVAKTAAQEREAEIFKEGFKTAEYEFRHRTEVPQQTIKFEELKGMVKDSMKSNERAH